MCTSYTISEVLMFITVPVICLIGALIIARLLMVESNLPRSK